MSKAPSTSITGRDSFVPGNVRPRPVLPAHKVPSFGERIAVLEWDADHSYHLIDGLQQELKFLRDTLELMESEAGSRDRAERKGR